MIPGVSTFSSRSDRLSPVAVALAVLLHGLVVLALWWMSINQPQRAQVEEAIEVSFEQPPPPPPQPPETKPPTPPAPPLEPGLRPPAPLTADRPTQALPSQPLTKAAPAPPPPMPAPMPREATRLPLSEPTPPQPLPPKPFDSPALPEPTPIPAPPLQSLLAPPPPAPRPELRPSPLTPAPQRKPPAAVSAEPPSSHPLVNPADAYTRARVADNYLWQVARKLEGYRYEANVRVNRGVTVVRIVIARDGRLLDASIARSSGVLEFDRGVLAGVRGGSPYTPLPPDIKGDSASFDLPLVSVVGR